MCFRVNLELVRYDVPCPPPPSEPEVTKEKTSAQSIKAASTRGKLMSVRRRRRCSSARIPWLELTAHAPRMLTVSLSCVRRCVVDPRSDVFGDPCPGVYKYMELEYMCSGTAGSE